MLSIKEKVNKKLFLIIATNILLVIFASTALNARRRSRKAPPKDLTAITSILIKGGYTIVINSEFYERKYTRSYYRKKRKKADIIAECTKHNIFSAKQLVALLPIAEKFKKLKLTVNKILHQSTCKSLKVAENLFNLSKNKSKINDILHYLKINEVEHLTKLQGLLSNPPLPGSNNVFITNVSILPKDKTGKKIKMSGIGAVILLPLGENQFQFINTIEEKEWQGL